MSRTFTGRHMLGCCVAFFGTIVTVNLFMAVQASRTFGGTVVDNSYVASQHFNRWLNEAKAESRRGWRVEIMRVDGHASLSLKGTAGPLPGAIITGIAEHPLGQRTDLALHFRETGAGQFRSEERLPTGRWRLRLNISLGSERGRIMRDLAA